MGNPFVHTELNTSDVAGAKAFYRKVFDWKLSDMPMGPGMTYTMIDTGTMQQGGGIQTKSMPEAPNAWLPYVSVENLRATVTKVRANGGQILVEHQEVPGMGALSVFSDPTGAVIAAWQPAAPPPAPKKAAAAKPAKKAAKTAAKKPAKKAAKTAARKPAKSKKAGKKR